MDLKKKTLRIGEVVKYYVPMSCGRVTPESMKTVGLVINNYPDYYLLQRKTKHGEIIKDTILKKDLYSGQIIIEKGTCV